MERPVGEMKTHDVLFSPADFAALGQRDLKNTVCVVLDIFRATSTMIAALANGAAEIIPVAEIPAALALRERDPSVVLAGERDGLRIRAAQTGSVDFDLGNSPREFVREKVAGKTIVMTTTNGTRALQACAHARRVFVGSFLNLQATADCLKRENPENLLVICSGTFEQTAYEDVLGAGALLEALWNDRSPDRVSDSTRMAVSLFQVAQLDLFHAASQSRNGQRLLNRPELREDVAFCLQRDRFDLVAELGSDGRVRALKR